MDRLPVNVRRFHALVVHERRPYPETERIYNEGH